MGTPQVAALTLAELLKGPDPVVGVVTKPDANAGRGQKLIPSAVKKIAASHQIPVLAPEKIRTPEFYQQLKAWQPQVIAVVAYGRILPKNILDLAPHGCINVHYSLLPKYRGAAPAAWTVINGEKHGGVSTMKLVEKMDAGAIYLQETVELNSDETTGSLQTRLTPIGARLLLETIRRLKAGAPAPTEQDESLATLAPMLKKEDGHIDWAEPAKLIEQKIRGLDPWPGAFTYIAGKVLKVHRAKVIAEDRNNSPGKILRADGGGFWIQTGAGMLSLEEVQFENKKRMYAEEFVKGARITVGDCFQ